MNIRCNLLSSGISYYATLSSTVDGLVTMVIHVKDS